MRLVTYAAGDGPRAGILVKDEVHDLERLMLHLGHSWKPERDPVRDFLAAFGARLSDMAKQLRFEAWSAVRHEFLVDTIEQTDLLPPVLAPEKVICVGLNYKDHVAETGRALPEFPDLFAKFQTSLIGPKAAISGRSLSANLDFEGEVALVIGKVASNVDANLAMECVAGLAPFNDVTARDLQYRGTQWLAGKAVDGATPWGPALVTLDEIADPQDLELSTRVNGIEMQRSNTKFQIFPMAQIVSYVSSFLTLHPGDVIATGTPQGIGAKRTPPVWLNTGDVVEIEVEGVGTLRNIVG